MLLHDLGAPALEQIAPRLDRVEVAAVAVHRETAAPAVVVDERHRRLAPVRLVLRAVPDARRDLVVAVAEDVRLDLDHVARDPLDRVPAAVELRLEPLDHHPVAGELEQALLVRRGRRLAAPGDRLQRRGVAAEHAERQRLQADRLAGLERQRLAVRRDVLEAADAAARLIDQRPGIDPVQARRIGVDQHDRGVLRRGHVTARQAQQPDHRIVRRGHPLLRPFGVERRRRRLHAVDRSDEAREIDARRRRLPRPVARARADHVQRRAAAVLVAHRHHHAARERGREQVAQTVVPLQLRRLGVADLHGEAFGVVAFGEGDGRRDLAVEIILLEQPGRAEVPPLGAVEQEVEAGRAQRQRLLRRAAERLGEEAARGVERLRLAHDRLPHLDRHLIGGIAAEPLEAELQVVLDQLHPVLDQRRARVWIVVCDLREVAPHGELARIGRIDRARRAQLAIGVAAEPLRVLRDQHRILGRVIDH